MKRFRAKPDWEGQSVAIVASGPSVLSFDFSLIAGLRTIAVKDGYKLVPDADVLMIGDHRYAKRNPDLSGYKGPLILYTDPEPLPECWSDERVRFIPKVPGGGISRNPRELRGSFTTTALAINLAVLQGSKRIYLVGVDARPGPNNERHFGGELQEDWHARYDRQKWGYSRIVRDMAPLGLSIINLNPKSAVTSFPRIDPAKLKPGDLRE